MRPIPVIVVFDIGKTNKKCLLFNASYELVFEQTLHLDEIVDEDGFPCENISALRNWLIKSFDELLRDERYQIKAINFSAYGASLVYLNEKCEIIAPVYNYLKPFPDELKRQFYQTYGDEKIVSRQTASPVLGSLNSGMQLYRFKYEQPNLYAQLKYALHLPQYLSFLFSKSLHADITSIGCHTRIWDFELKDYHSWVKKEGLDLKLTPILSCDQNVGTTNQLIPVGGGLHDSSAALIPYLSFIKEPFLLLSTGTWCISLNPFNSSSLTDEELKNDCLCYLSYRAKPVKASRLFAGYWHEQQVIKLATHFGTSLDHYTQLTYNRELIKQVHIPVEQFNSFQEYDWALFDSYEAAYHYLITDIVQRQLISTGFVLKDTIVNQIFVDGGFSKNRIFMQLLANVFPQYNVYAATLAQASALGAALVIHNHWNTLSIPADGIELEQYYSE